MPPIERTATPECVLRPHTQDRKAVECWAKPLKPLGRTSKRKAHRLRCSLTQNARSTPNAQRAGTRIAHETGGRTSNLPAPSLELIQPHAQAVVDWQNQGFAASGLLQICYLRWWHAHAVLHHQQLAVLQTCCLGFGFAHEISRLQVLEVDQNDQSLFRQSALIWSDH